MGATVGEDDGNLEKFNDHLWRSKKIFTNFEGEMVGDHEGKYVGPILGESERVFVGFLGKRKQICTQLKRSGHGTHCWKICWSTSRKTAPNTLYKKQGKGVNKTTTSAYKVGALFEQKGKATSQNMVQM